MPGKRNRKKSTAHHHPISNKQKRMQIDARRQMRQQGLADQISAKLQQGVQPRKMGSRAPDFMELLDMAGQQARVTLTASALHKQQVNAIQRLGKKGSHKKR